MMDHLGFINDLRMGLAITHPLSQAKAPEVVGHNTTIDVPCPYCTRPVEISIFLDPRIEDAYCDNCTLPFGIEFHDDGTVEPYDQSDPRFDA